MKEKAFATCSGDRRRGLYRLACKVLARAGYVPVTYDSMVTGWQQASFPTCATNGDQDGVVLTEDTPHATAYGASKRAIKDMLKDFGPAHGLRSAISTSPTRIRRSANSTIPKRISFRRSSMRSAAGAHRFGTD